MAENQDENIARWLSGELNDAEAEALIGQEAFAKYQQIIGEIDRWTPDNKPLDLTPEMITEKGKVVNFNRWSYISIAATVLITMFVGLWLINNQETSYYAELGTTKEIVLPDGVSKVILASNAEVSWKDSNWNDEERSLNLTGKAFFKVNPGSPFTVNTNSGNVQVLGTSFEVDEFSGSLSVKCFEGKVRATATNKKHVIVKGGESFLHHNGNWEDKKPISGEGPKWLNAESAFSNAPLAQVFKALEDQYDVEIVIGKVKTNRRFTGTIPNDNLEVALQLIFNPLKIKYELKDQKVYLSE
jgi:transmembrane sensor